MPSLAGTFEKRKGPTIFVTIAPGRAMGEEVGQWLRYRALLDTGALKSSISPTVAADLGLPQRGNFRVYSATGFLATHGYSIDLALPTIPQPVVVHQLSVAEFISSPEDDVEVILGRDILCEGVFTMSFDGHFTFSL